MASVYFYIFFLSYSFIISASLHLQLRMGWIKKYLNVKKIQAKENYLILLLNLV
jgi:hypothetical protein